MKIMNRKKMMRGAMGFTLVLLSAFSGYSQSLEMVNSDAKEAATVLEDIFDTKNMTVVKTNDSLINAIDYGNKKVSNTCNWTGVLSTSWNNAGNWSGEVPTSGDEVYIKEGTFSPIIIDGEEVTVSRFEIDDNMTVNIENGGKLICNGPFLVYSGTIIIENGGEVTSNSIMQVYNSQELRIESGGSLIGFGNGIYASHNVYVERLIEGHNGNQNYGWHELSSPVKSQYISDFIDINQNPITSAVDFYRWSESEDLWINVKNAAGTYNQGSGETYFSSSSTPIFEESKGYLISYENTVTKTFVLGEKSFLPKSVTHSNLSNTQGGIYQGYHLLGNQFTCALEWGTDDWNMTNVGSVAKIWNATSASYTDINAGGIIPCMNGFMVYVSSSTNSITVPMEAQVHNNTQWYKSTKEQTNVIKLIAHDPEGGTLQETVIKFDENSTVGFDMEYDSKFVTGFAPMFYSVVAEENLSTNTLPELNEELVIPLAFVKNTSENFYIEAEGLDNLEPDVTVYLKDKITGKQINLTDNPYYSFVSFENDNYMRFELMFAPVGINEISGNNGELQVYTSEGLINIINSKNIVGNGIVTNVVGQTVSSFELNGNQQQSIDIGVSTGVYIVNVEANDGFIESHKVILNK